MSKPSAAGGGDHPRRQAVPWQALPRTLRWGTMTTMNVSLPDELRSFVDAQVNEGNYGSTSEYVRELIRRDHDRRQLRAALLEGARAPVTATAETAYFASLRDQARART